MLETVVAVVAAVLVLVLVGLIVKVTHLSSSLLVSDKVVDGLKRKIKELEDQSHNYRGPSTDDVNRLVTTTVDTMLGDLVGASGLLANPALAEKIADKVIALLSNPLSQFSTIAAEALAKQLAHKLTVPSDVIDRLLRNSLPQLETAVREALEQIIRQDDDNDPMYEAVRDRIAAWLKEVLDDPVKREPFVIKMVEEVASRLEYVIGNEMDNHDTVDVWVRETLPGLLSTEMKKPDSELRQKLLDAVVERAVDALKS